MFQQTIYGKFCPAAFTNTSEGFSLFTFLHTWLQTSLLEIYTRGKQHYFSRRLISAAAYQFHKTRNSHLVLSIWLFSAVFSHQHTLKKLQWNKYHYVNVKKHYDSYRKVHLFLQNTTGANCWDMSMKNLMKSYPRKKIFFILCLTILVQIMTQWCTLRSGKACEIPQWTCEMGCYSLVSIKLV